MSESAVTNDTGIVREIRANGYEHRLLTVRTRQDHFGFEFDAGTLLADWEALVARAERAEAENEKLRATIAALVDAVVAAPVGG